MDKFYLNIVFLLQTLRQMFGAIHGTVLPAGTAECDLQMLETALYKTLYMVIYQFVNRLEKSQYLAVGFQKIYYRLIQPRERFVFVVLAGVMRGAAVKDVSSAITGLVFGDTAFEGERENSDGQILT